MTTRIDAALANLTARAEDGGPPQLASAIRYAVFPGGARIRPRLCIAVAEACGDDAPVLTEAAACALELLHCASLVHDDLPCFDNAALRRGKPSLHRIFGEPIAVLTGDALIVLAFEAIAMAGAAAPDRLASVLTTVARAVGAPHGIAAGQAWESEPNVRVETYHRAKTGSLFVAAAMCGALSAGRDPRPWRTMGERLGQAYQVADDLLDALALPEEAGKPTQRDVALSRPNALGLGIESALEQLEEHVALAVAAVPECPGAAGLRAMVKQMAERLVPASLRQTAA